MTVQAGTINGATLVCSNFEGIETRKVYMLSVSFPAYTGSTDTCQIAGVGAAIATATKLGKTNTLRWGAPGPAGQDTAGQAVYATGTAVNALTVSTDALTGQLSDKTGTELTTATASYGVLVFVGVDES
jgi:hypothetical protein